MNGAYVLLYLILETLIGAWSFDYITNFFGKDMPLYADAFCGFLFGTLSIPVAIVMSILHSFNVI